MEPTPPRRFRFSLLTLLIFSLLAGSVGLFVVRYRGGPWKRTVLLKDLKAEIYLSPRGTWVAFAADLRAGKLNLLRIRDGVANVLSIEEGTYDLRFSRDDNMLLCKADWGVEVWNTATFRRELSLGPGFMGTKFTAARRARLTAISNDGTLLVTNTYGDDGRYLEVWRIAPHTMIRRIDLGPEAAPMTVALSNDGKYLAHGTRSAKGDSNTERIFLWNIETGERREFELPDFPGTDAILFSPHDDYLLLGRAGTASWVWANEPYYTRVVDTATFSDKGKINLVIDADAQSFSSDGRFVVWGWGVPNAQSGTDDFEGFDFNALKSLSDVGPNLPSRASFSPSGTRVLTSRGKLFQFDSHILVAQFGNVKDARFLDDNTVVTEEYRPEPLDWKAAQPVSICRWERHYPEAWWGFAGLWEFWLMILLACGVGWSILRDRRILRRKQYTSGFESC